MCRFGLFVCTKTYVARPVGSVLLKLIHPVRLCHELDSLPGGVALVFELGALCSHPPSQCILHRFPAEQPQPQLLPPLSCLLKVKVLLALPPQTNRVYQLQKNATMFPTLAPRTCMQSPGTPNAACQMPEGVSSSLSSAASSCEDGPGHDAIFFARVPPMVPYEDLHELFSRFGEVTDLNLFRRWQTGESQDQGGLSPCKEQSDHSVVDI
jgi:hypothetical protein